MNKGRSGEKRTGRCQENIRNNPRGISCRKNWLNLPSVTFNRIVSKDLNWHPYRMQRRHGLKAGDFERRLQLCNWFCGQMITVLSPAWSSETKLGFPWLQEWTAKTWGQQPNFDYAVPESRERLTVWVGLCGNGELVGPVFFDRSVSGPYLQMLNKEVLHQIFANIWKSFSRRKISVSSLGAGWGTGIPISGRSWLVIRIFVAWSYHCIGPWDGMKPHAIIFYGAI